MAVAFDGVYNWGMKCSPCALSSMACQYGGCEVLTARSTAVLTSRISFTFISDGEHGEGKKVSSHEDACHISLSQRSPK